MVVLFSMMLSFVCYHITGRLIHLMMIYNLILAIIPYFIQKIKVETWWINAPIKIMWILFLPNTFYLLTDLIHIGLFNFKATSDVYSQVYVQSIVPWIELVSFILIIIVGCLLGLKSIHNELNLYPKQSENIIILVLSVLNAIGVYIGRYLRLNSWDILQPLTLFRTIFKQFNWFSMEFILLFAIIFYILIWVYHKHFKK